MQLFWKNNYVFFLSDPVLICSCDPFSRSIMSDSAHIPQSTVGSYNLSHLHQSPIVDFHDITKGTAVLYSSSLLIVVSFLSVNTATLHRILFPSKAV